MEFRWAFRMYDKDNSGSIELAEMIEIIGTLYEMEGVSKVFSYI
jgi:Ca2+-binding EF-hand superfamily protein